MRQVERLRDKMRREEAARAEQKPRVPVYKRIHDAASWYFVHFGTTVVDLPTIAAKAKTNTPTIRKVIGSPERLLVHHLESVAVDWREFWRDEQARQPDNYVAHVRAWIGFKCSEIDDAHPASSCRVSAAAFDFRRSDHPARALIRDKKLAERKMLRLACGKAGYRDPEALADKLLLLAEGGQVVSLAIGRDGPAARVKTLAYALLKEHAASDLA
jgi:hypothetical protein